MIKTIKEKKYQNMYERIRDANGSFYDEATHCPMIIEALESKLRISAFCKKAQIGERAFLEWVKKYPNFKLCYELGQVLAQETWEKEEEDNVGNPDWDRKTWISKGSRYFAKDKSRVILDVTDGATPWEQYQQIMQQASRGEFSASEIKQIMEAINIGTRVFEAFKLQVEVDKMKDDLNEMSQRHGNNSLSVVKTA